MVNKVGFLFLLIIDLKATTFEELLLFKEKTYIKFWGMHFYSAKLYPQRAIHPKHPSKRVI